MHGLATGRDQCAMVATKGVEVEDRKNLEDLARRRNPRLADVLESIQREKGVNHAIAIERALKTMAAVAHLAAIVPNSESKFATHLGQVVTESITKLVSIIGVDPEDLHGAAKASMGDMDDLFRMIKK